MNVSGAGTRDGSGVNGVIFNIGSSGSSQGRKEFTPTSSNLSQYFTTTQGIRIT